MALYILPNLTTAEQINDLVPFSIVVEVTPNVQFVTSRNYFELITKQLFDFFTDFVVLPFIHFETYLSHFYGY